MFSLLERRYKWRGIDDADDATGLGASMDSQETFMIYVWFALHVLLCDKITLGLLEQKRMTFRQNGKIYT